RKRTKTGRADEVPFFERIKDAEPGISRLHHSMPKAYSKSLSQDRNLEMEKLWLLAMPSQCYSSGLPFRPALKLGKFYFENTFSHARRYLFGIYAFGKTYVSAECGESSFPMQIGFSLFLDLHLGFRGQRQLVRASLDIQGFLLQPWKLCSHDIFVIRVDNINVRYSRRQFIFNRPLESPERIPGDQGHCVQQLVD